jgi:hypothetical protein
VSFFDQARRVADAVLYEGYILYPYRASARKNQVRWQFGVLAPKRWCDGGGCESSWMQTEILVEAGAEPRLVGKLRALQPQRRIILDLAGRRVDSLEAAGELFTTWDEGVDREVDFEIDLGAAVEDVLLFDLPAAVEREPIRTRSGAVVGTFVRERCAVEGEIAIVVTPVDAPTPLVRVRVRVDNLTEAPEPGASRDEALKSSLVGAHTLLALVGGEFISMVDPPEWARGAVEGCKNLRTWPVLVGPAADRSVVLSSPIILADRPEIAPESPGDLYDATEIDEILTLRTMTLTDDEKREARATDARAAAIIDRVDAMPPEMLERLHGALRSPRSVDAQIDVPFWDPGADASVSPETDAVEVAGVSVAKGSRVRLCPGQGKRRTDAQDMFLVGRAAMVQGVFLDVENQRYVAVTLEDDPAADLHVAHGRFLYFYPDEIEPLGASP